MPLHALFVDIQEYFQEAFDVQELRDFDRIALNQDFHQADVFDEQLLVRLVQSVVKMGVGLLPEQDGPLLNRVLQKLDKLNILNQEHDVVGVGPIAKVQQRIERLNHNHVILDAFTVLYVGDELRHQGHKINGNDVKATIKKQQSYLFS